MHGFVQNQGDAWTVTSAYLDRFVEEQRLLTAEAAGHSDEQAAYLRRMEQVGRRVAELQLALASRDDIVDFAPEPIAAEDVRSWTEELLRRARRTFEDLARRRSELPEHDRQLVDALLACRGALPARLRELLPETVAAMKIRHHGDFHLGQMLIVKDDVAIIDFEGEPRRSIEDRRRKAPAARDVAGLIRSIDYSATAALERALKSAPDEHGKTRPRARRLARSLRRRFHAQPIGNPRPMRGFGRNRSQDCRSPARFLPVGEGVLRNRIRACASAGLAAGAAGRHLAHPLAFGGVAAQ